MALAKAAHEVYQLATPFIAAHFGAASAIAPGAQSVNVHAFEMLRADFHRSTAQRSAYSDASHGLIQ
jgi:hypothetical protein